MTCGVFLLTCLVVFSTSWCNSQATFSAIKTIEPTTQPCSLEHVARIADEKFCDKYYVCSAGFYVGQFCPKGMAFNYAIQQCLRRQEVDCGQRTQFHPESQAAKSAPTALPTHPQSAHAAHQHMPTEDQNVIVLPFGARVIVPFGSMTHSPTGTVFNLPAGSQIRPGPGKSPMGQQHQHHQHGHHHDGNHNPPIPTNIPIHKKIDNPGNMPIQSQGNNPGNIPIQNKGNNPRHTFTHKPNSNPGNIPIHVSDKNLNNNPGNIPIHVSDDNPANKPGNIPIHVSTLKPGSIPIHVSDDNRHNIPTNESDKIPTNESDDIPAEDADENPSNNPTSNPANNLSNNPMHGAMINPSEILALDSGNTPGNPSAHEQSNNASNILPRDSASNPDRISVRDLNNVSAGSNNLHSKNPHTIPVENSSHNSFDNLGSGFVEDSSRNSKQNSAENPIRVLSHIISRTGNPITTTLPGTVTLPTASKETSNDKMTKFMLTGARKDFESSSIHNRDNNFRITSPNTIASELFNARKGFDTGTPQSNQRIAMKKNAINAPTPSFFPKGSIPITRTEEGQNLEDQKDALEVNDTNNNGRNENPNNVFQEVENEWMTK